MRSALTIAAKDLKLRLRDRSVLVMGAVAPFLLAFILNAVVSDSQSTEALSANFGVADQDRGEVGTAFVEEVEALGTMEVELTTGLTADQARDQVGDGRLDAAFVIPEGFSAAAASPDREAGIQVIGDVDEPAAAQIATAVAQRFADRVNATRLSVATAAAEAGPAEDIDALVDAARQEVSPVPVEEWSAGERQLDRTTYLIAGMSVLFLFVLVRSGVTDLLDERRDGTLTRLLAAPIPRLAIPAAKAMTSVVLGLGSMAVLVAASTMLMGASWGPTAGVALLAGGAVLAATAIMGVVAAVSKTPEQASSTQTMIAVVLAALGGSFFPVSQAGGVLETVARLTPHHWFLHGLGEASTGDLQAALTASGALVAFAVVIGTLGVALVPRIVEA